MTSSLATQVKTITLGTRHLFDTTVSLRDPMAFGETPRGHRRLRFCEGGSFAGDRLAGKILPNGSNWALTRPDGVGEFDVRLSLVTDTGDLIYMKSTGIFRFDEDGSRKVLAGQASPEEYYLRERTEFETSSSKYGWLNAIVAVGTGWFTADSVGMSVYEVL